MKADKKHTVVLNTLTFCLKITPIQKILTVAVYNNQQKLLHKYYILFQPHDVFKKTNCSSLNGFHYCLEGSLI